MDLLTENRSVEVHVVGEPIGQGSMRHIGNGRMIASNDKKLRPWRKQVTDAIRAANTECWQFSNACELIVEFRISRPKTVKREFPIVPYDLDKLIRAIGDSATDSEIISDDAIFCRVQAVKVYSDEPGVSFTITEFGNDLVTDNNLF